MTADDADRVAHRGGHAVVLGASVAGLLAARALVDAFERVTVVDRDPLDDGTAPRRGVPQGQHIHVLLTTGQRVMERLAPGFTDDLAAAGAVKVDFAREVKAHAADGFLADGEGDMPLHYASRPLIEQTLRARVADHERVDVASGHQVTRLAHTSGGDIAGVVAVHDGHEREIPADLVVDATGRGSRAAAWLEQLGYPVPPSERVHVNLAYRTCQVKRPRDDRRALLIMPSPPRARGAAVAPVENDRWIVTLFGLHGDHPPGDPDGLREFAEGLPTPIVRELLERQWETPDVAHYRFPTQTRRRYECLEEHPRGLLALGDAVASFNPIYGQGMSVAALEALALRQALADHDLDDLAPSFYARSAESVGNAWSIAAGGDFQFADTEGDKPPRADLANRYLTRLHRKAHTDGRLADAFARVAALEQPPASLLRPRVAWRVLRPQALPPRR